MTGTADGNGVGDVQKGDSAGIGLSTGALA
jgi:hypothetical protein